MFEIRPGHHRAGDIGLFGPSRQANPWFGVGAFLPESSSRRRPGSRRCVRRQGRDPGLRRDDEERSEEHTSELQSLMRISYAVFCLKKKTTTHIVITTI